MKRKLIFCFIILFVLANLFTSCTTPKENDPVSIDKNYLNQQILLRAPNNENTFRTGETIILELKYNSNYEITFPNDFNIQIFQLTKDGWIEIKEIPTTRIPSGEIVFSPLKYMPVVQPIFCDPDLSDVEQKYSLRVYVFGKMKAKGEIIEVAAFTDVTLFP